MVGAKLRRPVLPRNCLPRPRLLTLLDDWRTTRLIAITGAAGYGKSTLALLLLEQIELTEPDAQCVWLALDEDDDDPMRFTAAITAALGPVVPEGARQADLALHQHQPRQALLLLLAALDAVPTPIFLVLDDVHRIQMAAVHDLLQLLLERTAQSLHLVMLSRHSLPLSLSRWSLQHAVVEIDETMLRLTHDETAALVALDGGLLLDDASIDLLAQRTEGWIAGALLMLLSLQRHAIDERDFPDHLRGDNVVLAQYLTGEVLAQQDAVMREFLLECAILERLHAGLCCAVTGNQQSAQLLDRAMDERLFLRALDARGEWYELHHLFREMLLRTLEKQRTLLQIDSLHLAAAKWYGENGQVTPSVQHALAGHDPELAADLVERHTRPALLDNRWPDVWHWLDLLPVQQLDSHPQLLLDQAWLWTWNDQQIAEIVERAERAMQAYDALSPAWHDELAVLRLIARIMDSKPSGIHAEVLALIPHLDAQSHLARGWAWMAAAAFDSEKPDPDRIAYTAQAATELKLAHCEIGEVTALYHQAFLEHLNAEPSALATCRRAMKILDTQRRPNPSDDAAISLVAGWTCFWQDHIEEAEPFFTRALQNARIVAESHYILSAQYALQLCAVVRTGATSGSAHIEQDARGLLNALTPPVVLTKLMYSAYWEMLLWLALDRPHDVWRTFEPLEIEINRLTTNSPVILWLVALTAVVIRGHGARSIEKLLETQLTYCRQGRYRYMTIQLRLLLARYHQQQGRPNQARVVLRDVLHDVEQSGYIRTVLIHKPLKPLLAAEHTIFAQALVQKMAHQHEPGSLAQLSGQENRIFELLVEGYGIRDIAEQLVLSQATVKWHLGNVYRKLGVKGQRKAIQFARPDGIPETPRP